MLTRLFCLIFLLVFFFFSVSAQDTEVQIYLVPDVVVSEPSNMSGDYYVLAYKNSDGNFVIPDVFYPLSVENNDIKVSYKYGWLVNGTLRYTYTPYVKQSQLNGDLQGIYTADFYNGPPPPGFVVFDGAVAGNVTVVNEVRSDLADVIQSTSASNYNDVGPYKYNDNNIAYMALSDEIYHIDSLHPFTLRGLTNDNSTVDIYYNCFYLNGEMVDPPDFSISSVESFQGLVTQNFNGNFGRFKSKTTIDLSKLSNKFLGAYMDVSSLAIDSTMVDSTDTIMAEIIFVINSKSPVQINSDTSGYNIPGNSNIDRAQRLFLEITGARDPNDLNLESCICPNNAGSYKVKGRLRFHNSGKKPEKKGVRCNIYLPDANIRMFNVTYANVPGLDDAQISSDGKTVYFPGFANGEKGLMPYIGRLNAPYGEVEFEFELISDRPSEVGQIEAEVIFESTKQKTPLASSIKFLSLDQSGIFNSCSGIEKCDPLHIVPQDKPSGKYWIYLLFGLLAIVLWLVYFKGS